MMSMNLCLRSIKVRHVDSCLYSMMLTVDEGVYNDSEVHAAQVSVPGQRLAVEVADESLSPELLDQFFYLLLILLFNLSPGLPPEGFWDMFWGW